MMINKVVYIYRVTMASFAITLCDQCCRHRVVMQQEVSDLSVVRGC